jgi:hypothetical protein
MTMTRAGIVLSLLAGWLAGCGGPKYSVDYDPGARFDQLKNYRIEKNDQLLLTAREDLLGLNLRAAIEEAIERSLAGKGLNRTDAARADFVVKYRVDVQQTAPEEGSGSSVRREVTDANASGVNPYVPLVSGEPEGGPIDRKTGRVTIEMVDVKTSAGVWRGTTRQGIPDRSPDAKRMRELSEGIEELLTRFPPR